MPRKHRENIPGAAFHITARLQNGEPLLDGLQERVVAEMERSTRVAGMRLLAYAVVTNHLHLVVVQGRDPLSWHMQGFMRRVALMVQRAHKRQGHVVERRYYSSACTDAEYFRNVVAYVHLNAVRAGICGSVEDYPFTSHSHYRVPGSHEPVRFELAAEDALRVFATVERRSLLQCREDYSRFVQWRGLMDAFIGDGGDPRSGLSPIRPVCDAGDKYWSQEFGVRQRNPDAPRDVSGGARPDLEKIALRGLRELAPDLPLSFLRTNSRSRALVHVRRHVVARALEIGHRPGQVARYFNLSPSTVSSIAVALREGRAAEAAP